MPWWTSKADIGRVDRASVCSRVVRSTERPGSLAWISLGPIVARLMGIAIETWIATPCPRCQRQASVGRLTPVEYDLIMTTTDTHAA